MTGWIRIALLAVVVSPSPATAAESAQGANPCHITPWQTVDDGMGAEPGAVREFASAVDLPADCLRGGLAWIPVIEFNMTRSGTAETSVDMSVFIRGQETMADAALPGDPLTQPHMVTCESVPGFPSSQSCPFFSGPNSNQDINNLIAGDSFFVDVELVGDETAGFFVSVDEQGAVGEVPCFTTTTGGAPDDPCPNGNPLHSASGIGAIGYTFYGRYANGDQSAGNREPLATTFGARYMSGGSFNQDLPAVGGSTDIALREGPSGAVICQFLNIPDDFEYSCPLTTGQIDMLEAGELFVERSGSAPTESVRMVPADQHIFADGFESGDTSVWSNTVGGS